MTFREFIIEESGPRIARKLGVSCECVRLWKHRGGIPRSHWPALLAAFPATLTSEGLMAMELARQGVGR